MDFQKFNQKMNLHSPFWEHTLHLSCPTGVHLLNSKGPRETCDQGAMGSGSLSCANPLNLLPSPLFSDSSVS